MTEHGGGARQALQFLQDLLSLGPRVGEDLPSPRIGRFGALPAP